MVHPGQDGSWTPLFRFFGLLLILTPLRVALFYLHLPVWLSLPITLIFTAVPILAIYQAARFGWTPRWAALFLMAGLALHLGLTAIIPRGEALAGGEGIRALAGLLTALSQVGLVTWTVGLGALLASLIREKNMIVPISIFLALFDFYLILTPQAPVANFLEEHPQYLQTIGYALPGADANVIAYIGPADLFMLAVFFVAIFRFGMRARATLLAVLPVLALYLLAAILFPAFASGLPALVPMGITVLLVNAREFKMSKEELAATGVVAALGVGLILWGTLRPTPLAAPSRSELGPAHEAPLRSPVPDDPDRSR